MQFESSERFGNFDIAKGLIVLVGVSLANVLLEEIKHGGYHLARIPYDKVTNDFSEIYHYVKR